MSVLDSMISQSIEFLVLQLFLQGDAGGHNPPSRHGRFEVESVDAKGLESLLFNEREFFGVWTVEVEGLLDAHLHHASFRSEFQ